MSIAWSPEVKERAKKEKRFLVKLHVQGRYADRDSIELAAVLKWSKRVGDQERAEAEQT